MIDLIKPNWNAPENVKAYSTTRTGGFSQPPYDSLNLGMHTGDDHTDVVANRALLKETLELPSDPCWLQQRHDHNIICIDSKPASLEADGSFTKSPNKICVVQTADCLPMLLTNSKGTIAMALHCGWRGLAAGIVEKGVKICQRSPHKILAWLGPAIGQKHFEVGQEVYDIFVKQNPANSSAFEPLTHAKYLANLYQLAKIQLTQLGVTEIFGNHYDTYAEQDRFYSYRRNQTTGRMATLIWLTEII